MTLTLLSQSSSSPCQHSANHYNTSIITLLHYNKDMPFFIPINLSWFFKKSCFIKHWKQQTYNLQKYKALILKYVPYISKYMACIFYYMPCVFFHVPQTIVEYTSKEYINPIYTNVAGYYSATPYNAYHPRRLVYNYSTLTLCILSITQENVRQIKFTNSYFYQKRI